MKKSWSISMDWMGITPYMDHGAKILGRKQNVPKVLHFRSHQQTLMSLMSRMSLCKDCPSQRVGTYNSSVPSLQLFGIGMSTGPGRANRSLADLTRKKEVERQNGELSFCADPLKWSTSAWRPRSFRMRLQTSWLTGQTEALPRIIFDTAETKKGSAWHLHPVVIPHRTYGKYHGYLTWPWKTAHL